MIKPWTDRERLPILAGILERAFADYPLWTYALKKLPHRNPVIHWCMRIFLEYGLERGEVFVNAGDPQAVCVWLGPREPLVGTFRVAWLGLYQAPFRFGLLGTRRMQAVTDHWRKLQEKEARPY